jgi:hypothetical protein
MRGQTCSHVPPLPAALLVLFQATRYPHTRPVSASLRLSLIDAPAGNCSLWVYRKRFCVIREFAGSIGLVVKRPLCHNAFRTLAGHRHPEMGRLSHFLLLSLKCSYCEWVALMPPSRRIRASTSRQFCRHGFRYDLFGSTATSARLPCSVVPTSTELTPLCLCHHEHRAHACLPPPCNTRCRGTRVTAGSTPPAALILLFSTTHSR